ncbi:MAG: sulfatase-like hydrolase/transferase [Opitutales bacterium]|nr:sulfatase-like hydrolase/transferase [Opitutales bacterium]
MNQQTLSRRLLFILATLPVVIFTTYAKKPNILLIFSDDHAKKALSCYGNQDIKTPALDRIAEEGMRFEHALTPNSFCTPARAAALTGKYSHRNGVTHLNQRFDGSQQTFPKLLQKVGYETTLFGKWHLLSRPTGFDYFCVQKMQGKPWDPNVFEPHHQWIDWSSKTQKEALNGGRKIKGYNNEVITTEAIQWLKKKRDPSKPLCLLLHPKPPHEPYTPPTRYENFLQDVFIPEPPTLLDDYKGRTPEAIADIMRNNRILLKPVFKSMRKKFEKENPGISNDELTRKMYQEYIKGYYRLVKSVDDQVARVLDYLKESGLEKDTLVIYTSDQGFSLGEHGFYNKQWMYENPLHQPLLVRFPGKIKPKQVHQSMVNHIDLAPTLLDYAGLPIPSDMQGHSLRGILEGREQKVRNESYYHFYQHGNTLPEMIGIRTDTHKLIHYPTMSGKYQWELFDLVNDPEEINNLYHLTGQKDLREKLTKKLRYLIREVGDPVHAPNLIRQSKKTRLIERLKQGTKQTVVAYGTSLTKVGAWVDQLREVFNQQFPGQVTLINSAQGGANSDWGVENLQNKVLLHRPDCVFIEFSINDAVAVRRTTVEHARNNLNQMIDRILQKNPACEIIPMVMNPVFGYGQAKRPKLRAFGQNYRQVASERGFQLIDHGIAWNAFLKKDPKRFLFCMPDTVHPLRDGGLEVSTQVMIQALGLKPGTPEKNKSEPCFDYLCRMMDKDKNREVSQGEFDAFWKSKFNESDFNKNGKLSKKELLADPLFEQLDGDKSNSISLEEYLAPIAPHFSEHDSNRDSLLKKGEVWK